MTTKSRRKTLVMIWSAVCCALTGSFQRMVQGQIAAPMTVNATGRDDADPKAIFRAPLLREGSMVVDVRSQIRHDPEHGWWAITLPSARTNAPGNELILLPCTRLSEMQRIVEASPERTVEFQISGHVFVYRARNYLLPTYAPVMQDQAVQPEQRHSEPEPARSTEPDSPTESADGAAPSPPVDSPAVADSAADIMRELEAASGPLMQNPGAIARNDTEQLQGEALSQQINGNGHGSAPLVAEDTPIVNRRGKITRDSSGGWLFVLDADATGLADPPMRLQPCLLLERIEDYARREGNNSPALISGTLYLHNGRNYLMPSVFRIPKERRNISP